MKNTNPRLTRLTVAVQPYCFSVVHCRRTANNNANGLSRGALPINQGDDRQVVYVGGPTFLIMRGKDCGVLTFLDLDCVVLVIICKCLCVDVNVL